MQPLLLALEYKAAINSDRKFERLTTFKDLGFCNNFSSQLFFTSKSCELSNQKLFLNFG